YCFMGLRGRELIQPLDIKNFDESLHFSNFIKINEVNESIIAT
ncbi:4835_t:CDS:1, partial [Scutellospora calospora]